MPTIVDTSQFNAFCKQIAAQPSVKGFGLKAWDVMLLEVKAILEACVRFTTRENLAKIKRSIDFKNRTLRVRGQTAPVIYFTKSGIGWFLDAPGAGNEGIARGRKVDGKTFHPMTEFFRYGNPRWSRFQAFLAELKNKQIDVRAVIGRGARSWVEIGTSLGMHIAAPGYVRNAPAFRGRRYINGHSKRSRSGDGLFLEMSNTAPILLGTIDGNRILQRAINGRASYFRRNMKHAVFEDAKAVARAYPSFVTA